MNVVANIGHNNPPDPMEEIQANYDDVFSEVQNWLDGSDVENEGQMKAVDALLKDVKEAEKEAKAAKETEYRPHKDAGDKVISRWKVFFDNLGIMKKGLAAAQTPFKNKLAAEKEAARRAKWEEAEKARKDAERVAKEAEPTDLEAQREAAAAMEAAQDAQKAATAANKDTVKGMRTYTVAEIDDYQACINWIAANDKPALSAWMDDYVARQTREGKRGIGGVTVRSEKRAV